MIYKLLTAPTVEPVSLTDMKTHLRLGSATTDDAYITSLIVAIREHTEKLLGRALITQTWDAYIDDWPQEDFIKLPLPPLQSVTWIKYIDSDDITIEFSTANYTVDIISEPGKVKLNYNCDWISGVTLRVLNPINIEFVCGYGLAADIPKPIIQYIKMLVTDLYDNRETIVPGMQIGRIDLAEMLLSNFRFW